MIVDAIPCINDDEQKELLENLKKLNKNIFNDFKQKMKSYRGQYHINPIISSVSVLPKDEIAAMAESLVSLTSFKERFLWGKLKR